jgi:hypothetical protein
MYGGAFVGEPDAEPVQPLEGILAGKTLPGQTYFSDIYFA